MARLTRLFGNIWNASEEDVTAFGQWLLSSFLDAMFLGVWIALQRFPTWVLENYPLDGIGDTISLSILRVLFAITTILPILNHFVKNNIIMIFQTWQHIVAKTRTRNDT